MPKYITEHNVPGADDMRVEELRLGAQKSNAVILDIGPQLQWVHSYITADRIYCVYIAPNEQIIREHAQKAGFPADHIAEIKTVIDPTTAEG